MAKKAAIIHIIIFQRVIQALKERCFVPEIEPLFLFWCESEKVKEGRKTMLSSSLFPHIKRFFIFVSPFFSSFPEKQKNTFPFLSCFDISHKWQMIE